jgi:tetratricopeptide (TPR) repeat protein
VSARQLLERAAEELKSGNASAAKSLVDRAEELGPSDYEVSHVKAGALVQLGQMAEAEKTIEVSISNGIDEALLCAKVGELLLEVGNKTDAVKFLRRSLNTGSEDLLVYYTLSICLRRLKLIREAFELHLRMYKMALKSPEKWKSPFPPDVLTSFGDGFGVELPDERWITCRILDAQLRDEQYRRDNRYPTLSREEIEKQLKVLQQAVEEVAERMEKKRKSKERLRGK